MTRNNIFLILIPCLFACSCSKSKVILEKKQQKENGILVFSRDGKLVSDLKIKNPMVFLTVDSREENLYSVSYDLKEDRLYISRYNLPISPK